MPGKASARMACALRRRPASPASDIASLLSRPLIPPVRMSIARVDLASRKCCVRWPQHLALEDPAGLPCTGHAVCERQPGRRSASYWLAAPIAWKCPSRRPFRHRWPGLSVNSCPRRSSRSAVAGFRSRNCPAATSRSMPWLRPRRGCHGAQCRAQAHRTLSPRLLQLGRTALSGGSPRPVARERGRAPWSANSRGPASASTVFLIGRNNGGRNKKAPRKALVY